MAWVETRITRTSQPQDGVGIDWSNPITRGLILAQSGDSLVNAANFNRPLSVVGTLGKTACKDGKSKSYNSSVNAGLSVGSDASFNPSKITCFSVCTPNFTGSGRGYMLISRDDATLGRAYVLEVNQFTAGAHWYVNGGGDFASNETGESGSFVAGVRAVYAGTYDGSLLRLYRDGRLVDSTINPVTKNASTGDCRIGVRTYSGYNEPFGGTIPLSLIFNRALSDSEIKLLTDNPWQIFEPEVERIWISNSALAPSITQVQSDASLNYVLQALVESSRLGMYSILGLVNTDINSSYYVNEARVNSSSASYVINSVVAQEQPESYDVRSALSATQNETYNVLGAVTQSQNEEYNVLASLSNTQGSTYNVRSALSQDQGSTYFISESTYREQLVDYVIRSAQFNDQGVTYNILSANTVGNNASLNYVISALIQQDQQENYLVRSSSHQETNGIYTVRASAENSTEGSYIVRGSLSSEAQLDYTVRAEVNSEGTLSYTIRASLSKDQGVLYDILAANNVSSSAGGSYIIQATTANNTSCSYQIQGEVIDVPLTNAEMQQLYAWVSELVTKSATKEEIATAVWSKPTSELTVENSIGKWLMQKVLTVSKFLALK